MSGEEVKGLLTLAVDIGGSGLKMLVLDSQGQAVTKKTRVGTPRPADPETILKVFDEQFIECKTNPNPSISCLITREGKRISFPS